MAQHTVKSWTRVVFKEKNIEHYAAVTWKDRTFSRDPNWKRSLYGNDLLQCFSYSWNDLCECCLFLDRFLTTIFCEIDRSQETIFFKNYSLWRFVFYKKIQHTPQLCREIKLKVRIQFEKRSLHENDLLESCAYFWYDLLDFAIFLDRFLNTIFSENDRCRDAIFFLGSHLKVRSFQVIAALMFGYYFQCLHTIGIC